MEIQTRLVIVEGIMGSGKSTTARWIAAQLEAAGLRALAITERVEPHPVRGTDGLDHWFQPWLDVTAAGLADRSLAKWRTFVADAQAAGTIHTLDGQLFHGDLTNLFLMEATPAAMAKYCKTGLDGLVALYKDYRALTDSLYSGLDFRKLAIDNSQQAWGAYYQQIHAQVIDDSGRVEARIT
jgi:hypothetical protein